MNATIYTALVGAAMVLLQVLLAIPWLWYLFVTREQWTRWSEDVAQGGGRRGLGIFAVGAVFLLVAGLAAPFLAFTGLNDRDQLETAGRYYTAALQAQITVDLFLLGF